MKNLVFAAFAAAFSMSVSVNAQVINPDSLDRSADDKAVAEFLETNNKFEEKANGSMPFEDRQIAFVGGKADPVTLSKMIQRGWFINAGIALSGTKRLWGPKAFIGFGFEGKRWGTGVDLGYLKGRTHSQSDWQGTFNALEASAYLKYAVGRWHDGHTRFDLGVLGCYKTALDVKDLGDYHSEYTVETETEITRYWEDGSKTYYVKPAMFGARIFVEFSHQLYNKPIGFFARVEGGFQSLIANKENVNGNARGVAIEPTLGINAGIKVYLHRKAKNKKASEMIRH